MGFPPPATVTSHQAPALLVAELRAAQPDGGAGCTTLHNPEGLDLLQMLEGGAQSIAVITGHLQRAQGGPGASGLLVAVKAVHLHRPAQPGEPVQVDVALTHALAQLRLHRVTVTGRDGAALLTAELTTMSDGASP
jgi:hypothetical protein